MNALVVGGTSGLGLELAKRMRGPDNQIYITGRREHFEDGINYVPFDLSQADLPQRINELIGHLPYIDTFVYSAGYFQDGRITDLGQPQIEEMISVGGRGLIYFTKALLDKQGQFSELLIITSTSQWMPRQREPIYNFVKAGAAHFSNAMAEDGRIGKVLVAGPGGMRTSFWDGSSDVDQTKFLDPNWVANEIMNLRNDQYRYRFARIERDPPRVEIAETR